MKFPSPMVVVISYADVCTDFAKRVSIHNRTYNLEGRYAVSILKDISVENVLKSLHCKYADKYTNCTVENVLKHNFVYSFVCDQELLEKTLKDRRYVLIVPESLKEKICKDNLNGVVYLDKEF